MMKSTKWDGDSLLLRRVLYIFKLTSAPKRIVIGRSDGDAVDNKISDHWLISKLGGQVLVFEQMGLFCPVIEVI